MHLCRRHLKNITFTASILGLTSCAYAVDKTYQEVTFITPGAEYAQCDVYVDKVRYQAFPPQKVSVMKSEKDMEVRCNAPGNRVQSITVPSMLGGRAVWGTPVGMAWDYASEAMFSYPSVVAIDFSQEANKPNLPPRHNSPDVVQPEDYDLEEYLPGDPRLNSDRNKKVEPARRRDDEAQKISEAPDVPAEIPKVKTGDKGNLEKVMKDLKETEANKGVSVVPSVTPLPLENEPALEDQVIQKVEPQAGSAPVKLYPGQ